MKVGEALASARACIAPAEARLLLGHVLSRSSAWLEAHHDDPLPEKAAAHWSSLVARRAAGEPVAYLVGHREFYGRDFTVSPAVLIPRPETELLVDLARQKVDARKTGHVLDLGTGSGALAITLALELPGARVLAVDHSPAALGVARENARRLGAQVEFISSDWFSALSPQRFDLIVANPPYIAADDPHLRQGDLRFEPPDALTDHADGQGALRRIVCEAPRWLADGGWLMIEHGHDQGAVVQEALDQAGFVQIEQHRDLAGHLRVGAGCRRYCFFGE